MNIHPFNPKTVITWLLILGAILYFLIACSPTKRLARLHDKHPEIFTSATDTIHHTDTISVFVPAIQVDTFIHYQQLKDTIRIEKDGLSATVWMHADTVFVNAKTDTVTISVPYTVEIPVTKYITPPPKHRRPWGLYIAVAVICTLGTSKLLNRR